MKKKLRLSLIIGVILLFGTFLLLALPLHGEGEIYDKVIRLHVIAHSDSEEDQRLKLVVRDALLGDVEKITADCKTKDEAAARIEKNLTALSEKAEETLLQEGCTAPVKVTLSQENYPTREYEGVRLPAGKYLSLRVMIGDAEGHNWWCVLFPPLCVGSATAKDTLVSAGFTPGQVRLLTDSDHVTYRLRFKFLEIIESIFS